MFKVVSDQLKVSQGWVRCGQCATVFDASLQLQPEAAPQLDQDKPQLEPVVAPVATVVAPTTDTTDTTETTATTDTTLPSASASTPEAVDAARGDEISASFTAAEPASAPIPQALQDSIYSPNDDVSDQKPAEVSFVRDARRQAFWRRPLTRVVLIFMALLLLVLLALQLAVHQRDKLAALEPRLKPVLQAVCQALACDVGPVRQIDAIVIDSSSFNKINDSVYRLSFTVKNTALFAVAMPSLEVTLTDTQDQAVIRRVVAPAQFGMASGLLNASAEFSGALTLQLTPTEASRDGGSVLRRVAGYRLLAFYP